MRAASIVTLAVVGVFRLPLRVVAAKHRSSVLSCPPQTTPRSQWTTRSPVNVHGKMQARVDGFEARPRDLAGRRDALGVPICPEYRVLEHGEGEGVRQPLTDDLRDTKPR